MNSQINLLLDINGLLGMSTLRYKLNFTPLILWVKCTYMLVKWTYGIANFTNDIITVTTTKYMIVL